MAAAPSVIGEALPGVTVPGFCPSANAGLSCAILSRLNLAGASSKSTTMGCCPFLPGSVTGTISYRDKRETRESVLRRVPG